MKTLYQEALAVIHPIKLKQNGEAGHVACALETAGGRHYTGICVDVPCSIGLCAERPPLPRCSSTARPRSERSSPSMRTAASCRPAGGAGS